MLQACNGSYLNSTGQMTTRLDDAWVVLTPEAAIAGMRRMRLNAQAWQLVPVAGTAQANQFPIQWHWQA